jgi:DNA polymerase-3 subunit epsilon
VRELRLIASHKPRYNRRSRHPERAVWLKLTSEAFPRLSIVREVRDDGGTYLGPFGSSRVAEEARAAVHDAIPLRQCTQRLSLRLISEGRTGGCVLGEIGRCGAPCVGHESPETYSGHASFARTVLEGDVRPVVAAAAFVRGAARCQRLSALSGIAQLVAARPAFDGGWELHVVRYGRLAAAGTVPPRAHPTPYVEALVATAETVRPGFGAAPRATAEEMECVLRWLESPGVRLVEVDGTWSCPAHGAEGVRRWIEDAYRDPDSRMVDRAGRPMR